MFMFICYSNFLSKIIINKLTQPILIKITIGVLKLAWITRQNQMSREQIETYSRTTYSPPIHTSLVFISYAVAGFVM